MSSGRHLLLIIFWMLTSRISISQQSTDLINKFNDFQLNHLQEKLYVHTDRNFYICGETIWFRIYYVDGSLHLPLDVSKVVYLEIIGSDNKPVLKTKVALKKGGGSGSLFIPTEIQSGKYTLRAYTSWMKNFSPDFYFYSHLTIVNTFQRLGIMPADSMKYDLQFFPEGGSLVSGISNKIAFRAIGSNGKGIRFSGVILNNLGDTVARFKPEKFGIGYFYLTPEKTEIYKAVIEDPEGKYFTANLPEIMVDGYAFQLTEKDGLLTMYIKSNDRLAEEKLYVFVHTRSSVKLAESGILRNGELKFTMDKNKLGDGISHITIFNGFLQPVCERLYFIKPRRYLSISASMDENYYNARKKLNLQLKVSKENGNPDPANLSISVFMLDSLNHIQSPDILASLYLTSDLKGTIESPEWYFENDDRKVDEALDNLMLTHGWRRFNWKNVLSLDSIEYKWLPEVSGLIIQALVTTKKDGKPAEGALSFLSAPGKLTRLDIKRSDRNGIVNFILKDLYGPQNLYFTTGPFYDSLYNAKILDPFSVAFRPDHYENLELSDSLKETILSRSLQMQTINAYYADSSLRFRRLKVRDSSSFYGTPDKTYYLDDYTRFTVMEEVMREYVAGIYVRIRKDKYHFHATNMPQKYIFDTDPFMMLDGLPVFDVDEIIAYDPLKVEKLDVITRKYYFGPLSLSGILSYTTYQGDLAGFPIDPYYHLTKYEGMQVEREFYTPKYDISGAGKRLPDFRNLLYWNPQINTDAGGKGEVVFYTSDLPGKYAIVVQGLSKDGRVGSVLTTITIKNSGI